MNNFDQCFDHDLYKFMVGGPYEAYVERAVEKILNHAGDAVTALSVGCGNGDIEAAIGDRLDLTLHDLHGAAVKAHPELFWIPHLPNGQYDFVYAYGAVFACIPQEEKQQWVDDLASRVVDGGTLYLCQGFAKKCSCCRAKAFSYLGQTITEAVIKKGPGWQTVMTHIWGVQRIEITYYPAEIDQYWAKHKDRIKCVT